VEGSDDSLALAAGNDELDANPSSKNIFSMNFGKASGSDTDAKEAEDAGAMAANSNPVPKNYPPTNVAPIVAPTVAAVGGESDDASPVTGANASNAKPRPDPTPTDVALLKGSMPVDSVATFGNNEGISAKADPSVTSGKMAPTFTTPTTAADGPKMIVESAIAATKAHSFPPSSGMIAKTNLETKTASTDTSPPPKNLYSIFAAKMPSKSPPLTFTSLGKTRAISTKHNVSAASPSAAVAMAPTEAATDATRVTVAVETSPVAKDTDDASKNVSFTAASKDASHGAPAGVDTAKNGVKAPTATKPTSPTDSSNDVFPGTKPSAPSVVATASTKPQVDAAVTVADVGDLTDIGATDALAAEVLDATKGAFTTVADAIEAGLDTMTPSGFDSYASTGRKPGFQTASKASLSMHIQGPGATKPSTVTPSGIECTAPSTVDSVEHAGPATFVDGPRVSPTPTLGVPGASAITRIGTGPSDALGNTDTRANTNSKSDI